MKIKFFTIPNLLTLSNLLCGCLAAVWALAGGGDVRTPYLFIAAGALFDFCDGAAARLLRCPSPLGVQLDSLADMVSFGVAPAAILYTLLGRADGLWEWSSAPAVRCAVFVLAAFSALRLARFNIDDSQHEEFRGLPTPACAVFFASAAWSGLLSGVPREGLLLLAGLFSWLLISPVRMFSLKFRSLRFADNRLRFIFLAAAAALLLLLGPGRGVAAAIGLYIAVSAVRHVAARPRD